MLRSEAGIELIIEDDMRPEKQKRKPVVSGCGLETQAACIESQTRGQGRGPKKCLTEDPGSFCTLKDAALPPVL